MSRPGETRSIPLILEVIEKFGFDQLYESERALILRWWLEQWQEDGETMTILAGHQENDDVAGRTPVYVWAVRQLARRALERRRG